MAGIFGYSREAVRVKVKKCEGLMQPEFRKFSVDPQITSFEVLQSILAKAFDIKGEFIICYRTYDVYGQETYLPLLSDWDLDAAFLKAHNTSVVSSSEPCLCLRVDMKPFEESSDDWDTQATVSVITQFRTGTAQEAKAPTPRLPGYIMNQVEKTFNMVQKALNFGEDIQAFVNPPRPPLSDSEFRKFQDPVGKILHGKDLRSVIYLGGIDPSLRKVVWKHILNVYPDGMTGRERMDYIKRKVSEYEQLRDAWKDAIQRGPVTGDLAYTTGMVRKDVLRTDRHHKFYAGSDDNQNIASLFNILTTYALNHPKVSYCQGMSDLASPLLVTMGHEAHAYICFCALMRRLSTNFMLDGIAMTQKFTHLAEGLMYYDMEFFNYLKSHQADDLLFCYRWLLLEMKREFAFEDSLRMLEVLWSSLPPYPPDKELRLFETRFYPQTTTETPPISPLIKTPRENAYTKVCALRRQTSSISLASYMGKVPQVKRQNFSLDENAGRLSKKQIGDVKYRSMDDTMVNLGSIKGSCYVRETKNSESDNLTTESVSTISRSISPLETAKSDSVVINNQKNVQILKQTKNTLSSSMNNLLKGKRPGHFKDLREKITSGKITSGIFSSLDKIDTKSIIKEEILKENSTDKPVGKLVKNFNEFLNFSATNKNTGSSASISDSSENPNLNNFNSNNTDLCNSSNSKSQSSNSDIFDTSSPDDSQEYFPMTTSMTREVRLDLENLDRQVFGSNYNQKLLVDDSDSSCETDSSLENNKTKCDCIVSKSDFGESGQTTTEAAEIESLPNPISLKIEKGKPKTDDIFVWENPLHQSSPSLNVKVQACSTTYPQTPDEQADLEFDEESGEIIDESRGTKSITPIKLVKNPPKLNNSVKKVGNISVPNNSHTNPTNFTETSLTQNTNITKKNVPEININGEIQLVTSCEEVTETVIKTGSNLLPPPNEFGGGNPFLMFLCITVLLQHREIIIRNNMDYNEMAMHFDKMVRKHNVNRVLNQARQMYAGYIKQHTIAQQNNIRNAKS